MTIQKAIDMTRALLDTDITDEQLVAWLSDHDEQLWDRALKNYGAEHPEELPYTQYIGAGTGGANDFAHDLLIPDKYAASVYPEYLTANICRIHGDYERWNNGAAMYADMEQKMLNDITRDHRWKPPKPDDVPEGRPWRPVDHISF